MTRPTWHLTSLLFSLLPFSLWSSTIQPLGGGVVLHVYASPLLSLPESGPLRFQTEDKRDVNLSSRSSPPPTNGFQVVGNRQVLSATIFLN